MADARTAAIQRTAIPSPSTGIFGKGKEGSGVPYDEAKHGAIARDWTAYFLAIREGKPPPPPPSESDAA